MAEKAEKLYMRTRNSASSQSARRAKEVVASKGWMQLHPVFGDTLGDAENARAEMLAKISGFKPQETIFEVGMSNKGGGSGGKKSSRNEAAEVMKQMRDRYGGRSRKSADQDQYEEGASDEEDVSPLAVAAAAAVGVEDDDEDDDDDTNPFDDSDEDMEDEGQDNRGLYNSDDDDDDVDDDELEVTVSNHASSNNKAPDDPSAWQDPEVFMSYTPRTVNAAEERGYGVHSGSYKGSAGGASFMEAARDATMDLANDEGAKSFGVPARAGLRWDKKSARYVNRANDMDGSREQTASGSAVSRAGKGARMIRGESGVKIAASFQSGRYDRWKRAQRIGRLPRVGEFERPGTTTGRGFASGGGGGGDGGDGGGGPRYKHKQEKAPKQADKYRDDYEVRKKRVAEAKEKRVGRFRDGPGSNREIKGAEDIQKARDLEERKREKNARMPSSGRGKRAGGSRGGSSSRGGSGSSRGGSGSRGGRGDSRGSSRGGSRGSSRGGGRGGGRGSR